jgi:hypothetical protein
MNFNDSSSDRKVGSKPAERKSDLSGQDPGTTGVDQAAMDSAQKAQDRMHKNEQTNSSNTIFSK